MVQISIIAAISESRALGKDGKLLWHIPEDMKRFKKLTEGHAVIMGRKTFESIGKPLQNRMNLIITGEKNYDISLYRYNDIIICNSLEKALRQAQSKLIQKKYPGEVFVVGGGQIYQQAIKYTDKLYLTIVKGNFAADTFFPDYSVFKKAVYKKESWDKNYRYTFLELER